MLKNHLFNCLVNKVLFLYLTIKPVYIDADGLFCSISRYLILLELFVISITTTMWYSPVKLNSDLHFEKHC